MCCYKKECRCKIVVQDTLYYNLITFLLYLADTCGHVLNLNVEHDHADYLIVQDIEEIFEEKSISETLSGVRNPISFLPFLCLPDLEHRFCS